MTDCPNCGEPGDGHYVPSVGHDTPPEDAITPYYVCKKLNLLDYIANRYVVACTGPRVFSATEVLRTQLGGWLWDTQQQHDNLVVMSGAAEGWDKFCCDIAKSLGIDYVLAIPNPSYIDYYWSARGSRNRTDRLAEAQAMLQGAAASLVVCHDLWGGRGFAGGANFERNDFMARHADELVAHNPDLSSQNKSNGGTRHMLRLCNKKGIKITYFPLE